MYEGFGLRITLQVVLGADMTHHGRVFVAETPALESGMSHILQIYFGIAQFGITKSFVVVPPRQTHCSVPSSQGKQEAGAKAFYIIQQYRPTDAQGGRVFR